MSWIQIIEPDGSDGRLKSLFESVKGSTGEVDNILAVHSLRPHTLAGHMALYRSVMHHSANTLPKPLRESIGLYVSLLNKCEYCIAHHRAALERLIGDAKIAARIHEKLATGHLEGAFSGGVLAAMRYVKALTLTPGNMTKELIGEMRVAGLGDAEILEVNQIAAYFAYANRTAAGLGVETDQVLGLESGGTRDAPGRPPSQDSTGLLQA